VIGCSKEGSENNNLNMEAPISDDNGNNASDRIEEEPLIEETTYIRVLADALNVRRSYGLDSDVIGLIKKDSIHEPLEVYVTEAGREWLKIETDDYIGWIAGWYCMDNDEYENKVLKGNLLPAYEGKIPSVKGSFTSSYQDIQALYNDGLETTNYWGGPGLYNDKILYQFGDNGLAFISVEPEESMYGVKAKMTLEEVSGILGAPNLETTIEDPEGLGVYEDGSLVTFYMTGSYVTKFIFDENRELSRIELSK
jgi:hypothetical protein